MTTQTYFDTSLSINPSLGDVIDPNGVITKRTSTQYEITNRTGGAWQGFKLLFEGSDFSYDSQGLPAYQYAARLARISVLSADGQLISTIDKSSNNAGYFHILANYPDDDRIFENLDVDKVFGSSKKDILYIKNISSGTVVIGGGGNDHIIIGKDNDYYYANLGSVHGSNEDGTRLSNDEKNVLTLEEQYCKFATITNIDNVILQTSAQLSLTASQIGANLVSSNLDIKDERDEPYAANAVIEVTRGVASAVRLDLSGWSFVAPAGRQPGILIDMRESSAASAQNDTITGTSSADAIYAGYGNDTLRGGVGKDSLYGQEGNDTFIYGANEAAAGERVEGGNYADEIDAIKALGDNDFREVTIYSISRVEFAGARELIFDESINSINGFVVGDNQINTLKVDLSAETGGRDISFYNLQFFNWSANDAVRVTGSSFDDTLYTPDAVSSLDGAQGVDTLVVYKPGVAASYVIDFANASLSQTLVDGVTFKNFEVLTTVLGDGNDMVTGGALGDNLNGEGGADNLKGMGGRDFLSGGAENDILDGGLGGDELYGGEGDDTLYSYLGEGPASGHSEALYGGEGTDFALVDRSDRSRSFTLDLGDPALLSDLGDGTLFGQIERIDFRSGSGNDDLTGGALADILKGNDGRDNLSGGSGEDVLDGGQGIDVIDGGSGNDTLMGGGSIDTLDGGEGEDLAIFTGATSDYAITISGALVDLRDLRAASPDGADQTASIEKFQFTNGTFTLAQLAQVGSVRNQAPSVTNDAASVFSGRSVIISTATLLANDRDPENSALLFKSVGGADHGEVTYNKTTGNITFLADTGFAGTDEFSYSVADAQGNVSVGTVTIRVKSAAGNATPVALASGASGNEDAPISSRLQATDANSLDELTYTLAKPVAGLSLNRATGAFTYDPSLGGFNSLAAGQSGKLSFQFTATDGLATSKAAAVTINVTGLNDGPVAVDDTIAYAGKAGAALSIPVANLIKNDTDPDQGDARSFVSFDASGLRFGQLSQSGASLSYKPAGSITKIGGGASLTESFSYVVKDKANASDTGVVNVQLNGTASAATAALKLAAAADIITVDLNALANVANPIAASKGAVVTGFSEDDRLIFVNGSDDFQATSSSDYAGVAANFTAMATKAASLFSGGHNATAFELAGSTFVYVDTNNSHTFNAGDGLIQLQSGTGLTLGDDFVIA